ncbi:VENN motif pre-toxin domain-containing protein [Snodgrassella alvi]|uniref:VENN motif pre-toxin domain-containing protein n=1 Tax=Snodgrassella alvi TaxID=1196083 RepID=UPI0034E86806
MQENVKGSIKDLSSAIRTVAGGLSGGSLSNAQIAGELGQNAVENNTLINSKGESKLNAQERKINETLKKTVVQNMTQRQDGTISEITQSFHKENHSNIHINPNTISFGNKS